MLEWFFTWCCTSLFLWFNQHYL